MKYLASNQNPEKTIKHYEQHGNYYDIEYVSGAKVGYYMSAPDYAETLEKQMLKDAKERNNEEHKISSKLLSYGLITSNVLSLLATGAYVELDNMVFAIAFAVLSSILGVSTIEKIKRIREVKKYDMLFEIYNDLDTVNNAKFMEAIEFDHFYQKELNINTIDEFSYGEVKTLYRKLKNGK